MPLNTVPSNINNSTLFRDWLNTINAALYEERLLWNEVNSKAPKSHASANNTYGIGDNTRYGHLMITDDVTSANASVLNISSGTAATPKAVHDIYSEITASINEINATISSLSASFEESNSDIQAQFSDLEAEIENTYAPIYHAFSDTSEIIYGIGDSSLYGHVKLYDEYNTELCSTLNSDSGTAATPKALNSMYNSIDARISSIQAVLSDTQADILQNYSPIPHTSTDDTYGVGDLTHYGHLKISTGYNGVDFNSTEVQGNNVTEKFINNDNWSNIGTDIAPSINFLHDFYGDLTTVCADLNTRINNNVDDISSININIETIVSSISSVEASYAEKNHASAETTYGVGSSDLYGHLKITENFANNASYSLEDPTAVSATAFHKFLYGTNETIGYNDTISSINSNISSIQSDISAIQTDMNGLDDRIEELENNPAISADILFFSNDIAISNPQYSTYVCNDANSTITVTVSDVMANKQFTIKNETNNDVNVIPYIGYTIDKTDREIILGKNDSVTLKQNPGENNINFTVISSNVTLSQSEHIQTNDNTITVSMTNRKANYFEINNASCELIVNPGIVEDSTLSNDVEYSEKVVVLKAVSATEMSYPTSDFIWMNNAQPPKWGNVGETLILKLIQIGGIVYATVLHNSQVVQDLDSGVKYNTPSNNNSENNENTGN